MRDKVQCQHCGLDTDANGFVCTHCGALLADQTTISQYQKPALIYRRLLFLFIALAVCLGGLAYHTESKLLIRCFVVCLGLMTLCIAQLNVATGRTHAMALSSIYRNKNPVAFRIVTVLNYLVGFAAIMGGLFLGTDVVFN
jgi:hypothetical protein